MTSSATAGSSLAGLGQAIVREEATSGDPVVPALDDPGPVFAVAASQAITYAGALRAPGEGDAASVLEGVVPFVGLHKRLLSGMSLDRAGGEFELEPEGVGLPHWLLNDDAEAGLTVQDLWSAHGQAHADHPVGTDREAGFLSLLERLGREEGPGPKEWPLAVLQAQPRPEPRTTLPPVVEFSSLPRALEALIDHYSHVPDAQLVGRIDETGSLPPEVQEGLARIVAAHLFQAQTTRMVFDEAQEFGGPADLGALMGMRDRVARIVLETAPLLYPAGGSGIDVCGLVAIDLTVEDDEYTCDYQLLVDAGGSDIYRNNAGGGDMRAAMLVDLAGDDEYLVDETHTGRAVAGSGFLGTGFLFSFGGSDRFDVVLPKDGAINGGGMAQGVGLLVNQGTGVTYRGETLGTVPGTGKGAINGGGLERGSGALVNLHGNNTMTGVTRWNAAVNGAASIHGSGLLVNGDGGNNHTGVSRGLRSAINGAAYFAGTGVLVNLGGDNQHHGNATNDGMINGGAWGRDQFSPPMLALGAVLSHGGNNSFTGQAGGFGLLNGAGMEDGLGFVVNHGDGNRFEAQAQIAFVNAAGGIHGNGYVLNHGGNNTFEGTSTKDGFINGAGYLGGSGTLVNLEGNNTYQGSAGEGGGINGAAGFAGRGLLWDREGGSSFNGTVATEGGVNGAAGGLQVSADLGGVGLVGPVAVGSLGVLVTGTGDDSFSSNGTTQGAGSHYGTGILLNLGGNNTYVAREDSVAQGAGRHGGLGILVDLGEKARFTITGNAQGQGLGQQGIGLLARPDDTGETVYSSAPQSILLSDGGGMGILLDRSGPQFLGGLPDLSCPGSEVHELDEGPHLHARVCEPDPGTQRDVLDPASGSATGESTSGGFSVFLGPSASVANLDEPGSVWDGFLSLHSCDPVNCMTASRLILPQAQ